MAVKSKGRLEAIIRHELANCIGIDNEQLSNDRLAIKSAYLGDGYPVDKKRNEQGWSVYVDRTVMETVEWAKGPLLKVFAGTEDIVRFEPTGPEDEQYAEDATDYVNKVVFGRHAFDMVYGPLTDGLYQRVGWVKVHYENKKRRAVLQELDDLSSQEAMAIAQYVMMTPDAEIEFEQDKESGLYHAIVFGNVQDEQICVTPIPSERVIYSEDATSIENARFIAHWEDKMVGELIRDGYDKNILDTINSDQEEYPETQRQRLINSDETDISQENVKDGTRLIRVYEAYMTADLSGKGKIGSYKVVFAGTEDHCTVLDMEEWTMYRPPIFGFSSLPLPYSPVGMCLADLVIDLQKWRTELIRNTLDNVNLANHGELVVNRKSKNDRVNYDQLLSRRPAGIYETVGEATITPLPVNPVIEPALAALELTDKSKEQRTGIGMNNQGLSADVLQNTATGAAILEENQNIRLEMIARIFAETYKQIAKYVLALANRYIQNPIQFRRRGQFASISPSLWNPAMEVVATVGLGTGNRQKKAEAVAQILTLQERFVSAFGKNSPIRMENLVRTAHKLVETVGLEFPEQFFGTIEDARKAEQELMQQGGESESPEMMKLQMQQKQKEAELQLRAQAEEAKMQLERQKAEAELANEAARFQADMILKATELQQRGELSQRQMELEAELDAIKLVTSLPAAGATIIKGVNTL